MLKRKFEVRILKYNRRRLLTDNKNKSAIKIASMIQELLIDKYEFDISYNKNLNNIDLYLNDKKVLSITNDYKHKIENIYNYIWSLEEYIKMFNINEIEKEGE